MYDSAVILCHCEERSNVAICNSSAEHSSRAQARVIASSMSRRDPLASKRNTSLIGKHALGAVVCVRLRRVTRGEPLMGESV